MNLAVQARDCYPWILGRFRIGAASKAISVSAPEFNPYPPEMTHLHRTLGPRRVLKEFLNLSDVLDFSETKHGARTAHARVEWRGGAHGLISFLVNLVPRTTCRPQCVFDKFFSMDPVMDDFPVLILLGSRTPENIEFV